MRRREEGEGEGEGGREGGRGREGGGGREGGRVIITGMHLLFLGKGTSKNVCNLLPGSSAHVDCSPGSIGSLSLLILNEVELRTGKMVVSCTTWVDSIHQPGQREVREGGREEGRKGGSSIGETIGTGRGYRKYIGCDKLP